MEQQTSFEIDQKEELEKGPEEEESTTSCFPKIDFTNRINIICIICIILGFSIIGFGIFESNSASDSIIQLAQDRLYRVQIEKGQRINSTVDMNTRFIVNNDIYTYDEINYRLNNMRPLWMGSAAVVVICGLAQIISSTWFLLNLCDPRLDKSIKIWIATQIAVILTLFTTFGAIYAKDFFPDRLVYSIMSDLVFETIFVFVAVPIMKREKKKIASIISTRL